MNWGLYKHAPDLITEASAIARPTSLLDTLLTPPTFANLPKDWLVQSKVDTEQAAYYRKIFDRMLTVINVVGDGVDTSLLEGRREIALASLYGAIKDFYPNFNYDFDEVDAVSRAIHGSKDLSWDSFNTVLTLFCKALGPWAYPINGYIFHKDIWDSSAKGNFEETGWDAEVSASTFSHLLRYCYVLKNGGSLGRDDAYDIFIVVDDCLMMHRDWVSTLDTTSLHPDKPAEAYAKLCDALKSLAPKYSLFQYMDSMKQIVLEGWV